MAVLIGTPGNDRLIAPDARENDSIAGDAGDDFIEARGGDDRITPGPGNDRVEGGDGRDTVIVSGDISQTEVYRYNNEGVLRGPDGLDTLLDVEAVQFTGVGGTLEMSDANSFLSYSYIASYGDLTEAYGADAGAGWRHFRDFGAVEGREITFNGNAYLAANTDVLSALGANADESGARHYLEYGRFEGRTTEFAALSYTASYGELIDSFGTDTIAATAHFVQEGFNEGRGISFNGLEYVASYGDLIDAYGDAERPFDLGEDGAGHYIQYGRGEGRETTFDGLQYMASYGDVIEAFRDSTDAGAYDTIGALHYIRDGFGEERVADRFNEQSYAAANGDLAEAGITSADALALHWIQYGYEEGRAGAYDPVIA